MYINIYLSVEANMKTPKEMQLILSDRNLKMVAEKSGVNYRLVRWIASGKAEAANLEAYKRLSDYLEATNDQQ
jgi:hypothetical protein